MLSIRKYEESTVAPICLHHEPQTQYQTCIVNLNRGFQPELSVRVPNLFSESDKMKDVMRVQRADKMPSSA